jgi:hypothetical protein
VRRVQVVTKKTLELVAVRSGWWSAMIERADVVSEGAVEEASGAGEGAAYYGTTSLRCPVEEEMVGSLPAAEHPEQLARVIVGDAQARLRILRLAHREAVVRASAPLDVMQAEIDARVIREGEGWILSIEVDVSAPVVGDGGDSDEHSDAM